MLAKFFTTNVLFLRILTYIYGMDLGGINLGEIWTTVGGVLGTPAAIFLFWTYSKVNDLANKVKFLEQENRKSEQTLSDIRVDVSFIRGKMEGKMEGDK